MNFCFWVTSSSSRSSLQYHKCPSWSPKPSKTGTMSTCGGSKPWWFAFIRLTPNKACKEAQIFQKLLLSPNCFFQMFSFNLYGLKITASGQKCGIKYWLSSSMHRTEKNWMGDREREFLNNEFFQIFRDYHKAILVSILISDLLILQ